MRASSLSTNAPLWYASLLAASAMSAPLEAGSAARLARRNRCGATLHLPLEVAAREAHEVSLGHDTDELAVIRDRQTAELTRLHETSGVGRGGVGRDSLHVLL